MAIKSDNIIPGGIANGIIGTLLMVLMASAVAIPIGVLAGIYLSEKRTTKFSAVVRFVTDLLQGYSFHCGRYCGICMDCFSIKKSYSAVAGSAALAINDAPFNCPINRRNIKYAPNSLKEAGLAFRYILFVRSTESSCTFCFLEVFLREFYWQFRV